MPVSGPKYQAVIDWVKQGIESGEMRTGDRLLSEKELSEKFGLSRQTIRHATGELENLKLITRMRGSGTYIGAAEPRIKRQKFMNVAVIVTYLDNYIFPPTLRGISDALRENGYTTQVSFTDDNVQKETEILEALLQNERIDGVIAEPTKAALPNPNIEFYQKLKEKNIPIIFFNAEYPELDFPCIRLDDEKIAERAVRLLTEAGHKRIAGLFQMDDRQGILRYSGFMTGMKKAGLSVPEETVVWFDTIGMRHPAKLLDYFFYRIKDCTAVVCYNDNVAVKIIKECDRRGIRVPEDLSIVGIDNADVAKNCTTPVTTFPHPKEELGRVAAEAMVRMIDDPSYDGSRLFLPEPIIRDSIQILKLQ